MCKNRLDLLYFSKLFSPQGLKIRLDPKLHVDLQSCDWR